MNIEIEIAAATFCPYERLARFDEPSGIAGASAAFVGRCRRRAHAGEVEMLELQHYPGFTERSVGEHAAAIATTHQVIDALIVHRTGLIAPGEAIVLVAMRALGRASAQRGVEQLMDYLKTDAPFWKREHYRAAPAQWIEPTQMDRLRQGRWS